MCIECNKGRTKMPSNVVDPSVIDQQYSNQFMTSGTFFNKPKNWIVSIDLLIDDFKIGDVTFKNKGVNPECIFHKQF